MRFFMKRNIKYSESVRSSVLAKALAPNAPSVVELAKEFNIPVGTIYTWKFKMSPKKNITTLPPQRPNDKTPEAKLRAVIDTNDMTEQERSVYCREHGYYVHHLDEWRKQFLQAFDVSNHKSSKAEKQLQHENKQLKLDLRRKDKALAEVSALLILKKKQSCCGG